MVQFLPLDVTDEDSVGVVLSHIDNAIQYGENEEPKEPKDVSPSSVVVCGESVKRERTDSLSPSLSLFTPRCVYYGQMDNGDFDTGE